MTLCSRHTARIVRLFPTLWPLLLVVFPALALAATSFTGQVVGISDGDTLSVMQQGKAVKVRLHGVDTPEKRQPFSTKAQQFTADLAFKQTVTVVVHDTDRYGRLVGDVLLPDGRSLNRELVRAGLAWWYRQYAPKDAALEALEAEARTAQRGLWSDPHAVAPWAWRRQPRASSPSPQRPMPAQSCCKTCRTGQACGDSCIPRSQTCTAPPGCACQG